MYPAVANPTALRRLQSTKNCSQSNDRQQRIAVNTYGEIISNSHHSMLRHSAVDYPPGSADLLLKESPPAWRGLGHRRSQVRLFASSGSCELVAKVTHRNASFVPFWLRGMRTQQGNRWHATSLRPRATCVNTRTPVLCAL